MVSFSKSEKLHLDGEFRRVFKRGRFFNNEGITVIACRRYCRNVETAGNINKTRLGIVVSAKFGKAVDRNELKRRLREIFASRKHLLNPEFDVIFLIRQKLKKMNFQQLNEVILSLLRRAEILSENGFK